MEGIGDHQSHLLVVGRRRGSRRQPLSATDRLHRQREVERAARREFALGPHSSPVGFDDAFRDVQTDA